MGIPARTNPAYCSAQPDKPVLFERTKDSQRLQWRRDDGHVK